MLDNSIAETAQTRGTFRVTGLLTAIWAPLIALLGADIYFAGVTQRDWLLSFYGIQPGIVDEALQSTMARGYLAALLFGVVLIGPAWSGFDTKLGVLLPSVDAVPKRLQPLARMGRRYLIVGGILFLSFAVLGTGWLAGFLSAHVSYSRQQISILNGCTGCFVYSTPKGQVVGMPLVQDTKRLVLATRAGASVVDMSLVRRVRPINRLKGLFQD